MMKHSINTVVKDVDHVKSVATLTLDGQIVPVVSTVGNRTIKLIRCPVATAISAKTT